MSGPYDWRINEIEQKAERATGRLYELDALRGELDRMEHTVRQLSSEVVELRAELQTCKEQQAQYLIEQGERNAD